MLPQQLRLFELERKTQKSTIERISENLEFSLETLWPDRFGETLRKWASTAIPRPIRTLSLFSGGGGLDIGFHDAGFSVLSMLTSLQKG